MPNQKPATIRFNIRYKADIINDYTTLDVWMQVSTQMLKIRKHNFEICDPLEPELGEKNYYEIKIPYVSKADRIPDKQINSAGWLTAMEMHLLGECEREIRNFIEVQLVENEKKYDPREWAFDFIRDGKE